MLNRYIYIWDIHWNKNIIDFINKENDWKTFFILMWDIFDRWNYSFEIFECIKKIYLQWKLQLVLWNHDLMFILSTLTNYLKNNFLEQWKHPSNWMNKTLKSFRKNIQYKDWINTSFSKVKTYMFETANFLFKNFNTYYIDDLNNLSIHGWIPIMEDWNIVWESFWYNNFSIWLDRIIYLNNKLKNFDEETLRKYLSIYSTESILRNNSVFYNKSYLYNQWDKDYCMFIETWFLSRFYEDLVIKKSLENYLDNIWINRLFIWHDSKDLKPLSQLNNFDRIIRLDHCIWITIYNNKNNLINTLII